MDELQTQFEELGKRKLALFDEIKDKPNGIRELTPQQQEINQIDEQLWVIRRQIEAKEAE